MTELPLIDAQTELGTASPKIPATSHAFSESGSLVHELITRQAAFVPTRPAVEANGERLTYAELDAHANRLAHYLRNLGIGPDVLVGLCMNRSVEMVVAMLAIWKAGGAYVPLDPDFPQTRLKLYLEDSQAPVVITQRSLRDRLSAVNARVVDLDAERDIIASQPEAALQAVCAPTNLAYVIYTSGSTGTPNGVAVEHRALVNFLNSMRREPGLTSDDVLAAVTTVSFDIHHLELWLPLTTGARVALLSRELAADGTRLATELDRLGATVLQATPATWRLLLNAGWSGRAGLKALCGGEAMPPELAAQLLGKVGELWNMYGPTETTVWSTIHRVGDPTGPIPIGHPIANTRVYVLDPSLQPVPPGSVGELYIGGDGLARGYWNRPELTAARFVSDPFRADQRMYKTGDLGRLRADGLLECLGRIDHQVKINGHRIELAEIESALATHPGVRESVVVSREAKPGEQSLVGYVVPHGEQIPVDELRQLLRKRLPEYMVPAAFVSLKAFPLTPNGKIDRKALPAPSKERPNLGTAFVEPSGKTEEAIAAAWREVLELDRVGADDGFFEVGGTSLALARVQLRLKENLGVDLPLTDLFQFPTITTLAAHLDRIRNRVEASPKLTPSERATPAEDAVAVIGMAGRFPGAANVEEFWRNLCDGVESVTVFTDEELLAAGVPEQQLRSSDCIKSRAILTDADRFDAGFFGIQPREADITDPQHRLFLECCWAAMEHAGYDPTRFPGLVGVFAGSSMNTYLLHNLLPNRAAIEQFTGEFQSSGFPTILGNDKDYLASRVAFKLNLRGPSLTIQTASSTSLVAICQAVDAIRGGQCDAALAGGVSVSFPQRRAAVYQEGSILAPDGHCRSFDADARGTVFGEGVGVVVLKRLAAAIADGDTVYAIVRGVAVTNDGAEKVSIVAPSVSGQAEAVARAIERAGVSADTIGYVEGHGTGTPVGDPIEVAGLTQAFRRTTDARGYCVLGTAKPNIGHLEAAAGVAGFIKATLALHHRQLPPTLHYKRPNPAIDFDASPFVVRNELSEWPAGSTPRRAGVSSMGMGGTNAHAVLEEAPPAPQSEPGWSAHLFVLSARSSDALNAASDALADHLRRHPEQSLADVGYTLQVGRKPMEYRRAIVCSDREATAAALASRDRKSVVDAKAARHAPPVAFLFPGQGSQYPGMGRELYANSRIFREQVDHCAEVLQPHLDLDLRDVLFPTPDRVEEARRLLNQTRLTQPALFVTEYALSQHWASFGIRPAAMLGHSVGEYVAACLAGVFSLDDALALIACRGRMVQETPSGAMLAVRIPEQELNGLLHNGLALAAVNGPGQCVLSGAHEAVAVAEVELTGRQIPHRRLMTSHAFHSPMLDPIVEQFREVVSRVDRRLPRLPFISCVTGTWITPEEATDPDYWATQLRQTVRFADGLAELRHENHLLLEVGPGHTLTALAQRSGAGRASVRAINTLPAEDDEVGDLHAALTAVGRLWIEGVSIDWNGLHSQGSRRRVPLPTYPFERRRHWIEPPAPCGREAAPQQRPEVETPTVTPATPAPTAPTIPSRCGRLMAEMQAELARLGGINPADLDPTATFVQLGFDSLFLTQAVQAIRTRYGVRVAFRDLLEGLSSLNALAEHLDKVLPPDSAPQPTPAAPVPCASPASSPAKTEGDISGLLAKLLDNQRQMQAELETLRGCLASITRPSCDAVVSIKDAPPAKALAELGPKVPAEVPLTDAQTEIWLSAQMGPEASNAFIESCTLEIDGAFDLSAFRQAVREVTNRHEALRATFNPSGDAMCIADTIAIDVPLTDLSDKVDPLTEANLLLDDEGRTAFDLTTGPLIRVRVLRLAANRHWVVLSVHHVACDGWSYDLLVRELATSYSALVGGTTPELPPAPSFREYAEVIAKRDASPESEHALAYWRKQFAELPPPLELPADRPRTARRSYAGASLNAELGKDLADATRKAAAQHGVTVHTWLLTTFHALLHRLTGQTDVVVGTPSAGQVRAGFIGLVGHCVDFLPIRVAVDPDRAFREVVEAVKQSNLDAGIHPVTYLSLLRALGQKHEPERPPLLSVTFNLDPVLRGLDFGGAAVRLRRNPRHFVNFDLQVNLADTGSDYVIDLAYNADLYDRATISRWIGHYRTLLAAAVADSATPVGRLTLLTPAELRQIVTEFNDTAVDYPRDRCTHELIAQQAARTPNRVAVEDSEKRLTYAELDTQANRLAHYLQQRGVGPDVPVGLCVRRSVDMVVAMLAVWKAGGAYVPLDPALPLKRLESYLADSAAPVVITQTDLRDRLPAGDVCVVDLDAERAAIAGQSAELPRSDVSPANLAFMIYTSGSTGTPNGVDGLHRGLVNLLTAKGQQPQVNQDDVVAAVTTVAFDLHLLELWLSLSVGARVAILTWEDAADGLRLAEELDRIGATVLMATPARWRLLLAAGWSGRAGLKAVCGGEPMSPELAAQLLEKVGELWNVYGPTETTVYSTTHHVEDPTGPIPVGRPIANTQVYVLDRFLQPVPLGCVGATYIGGDGVARGYRNRPELTAARFVSSPFHPGERIYKTGDLGRLRPDGVLECLGRIDFQVKLNGHRIELGEIETTLAEHPAVATAVLRVWGQPPQLAAYIVPRPQQPRSAEQLRQHIRERLPSYMVPTAITFMDSLPLTPNGKVDRRALPEPGPTAPDRVAVAPRTDAERDLLAVWMEVLGNPNLGVTDDFFEVGGTSLRAGEVVVLVRRRLGHTIPLGAMYEAKTVEKMAIFLQNRLETATSNALVPLQTGGTKPPLFMIAGIGGHVFTFHKFAHILGADYPVYGLKAIGVDGGRQPLDRFEDIAAEYVREITAACPHGPYVLSGYSIGAHVAFEVALQLQALGHEVPLLIAFDVAAPGYPPPLSWPRRLAVHARNLFRREGGGLRYATQRLRNIRNRILRMVGLERLLFPQHPSLNALPQEPLRNVWLAMQRAFRQYQPHGRLKGTVALFRSEVSDDLWDAVVATDPHLGWKERTTRPVELTLVPLGHLEVFHESNINSLAAKVADMIERATMEPATSLPRKA